MNFQGRSLATYWIFFSLIALLGVSLPALAEAPAADGKRLLLASDPYCPYTCEAGSNRPGFMVEFAQLALGPLGYSIEYAVLPWSRVMLGSEKGQFDGVITVDREDGKNLQLSRHPIASTCQAIATRRMDAFQWSDSPSLGDRRLVIISGYTYGGQVRESVALARQNQLLTELAGEDALARALGMIVKNRLDATIGDCNVMAITAQELGIHDELKFQLTGFNVEMFIGINKARADAQLISDAFDNALQAMRKDGRLQHLALKYSISNL